MKKFIYMFNISLLLLVPISIWFSILDSTTTYKTNTNTTTKMIKTIVFIDRDNKKKEEEEKKQEQERREKEELERLEAIEKQKQEEAAKVVEAVKQVEYESSLASNGAVEDNKATTTVYANSDKLVFEGAKFYDRKMSSYGTDCCGSIANISEDEKYNSLAVLGLGRTASGYQLEYKKIYFNAGSYGNVRIVAADKNFPIGTIVKITERMDDGSYDVFNAIVLDRGDKNIGLNSKFIFDLLSESQQAAYKYGVHIYIDVEVLKLGTSEDQKNIIRNGHL